VKEQDLRIDTTETVETPRWLPVLFSITAQFVCFAQPSAGQSPPSTYVTGASVPVPVLGFLSAFGDRISKPGRERTVLTGTVTDKFGTGPAQLTWEAPGKIRFDRANQPGTPLTFSDQSGLTGTAQFSPADADMLESLLDDASENFFYQFIGGGAFRLLGLRFRADNGKAGGYSGPWFDVYTLSAPVKAQPAKTVRVKQYYFDSTTKLLAKTCYASSGRVVTTEFNKWSASGGQAVPGQIIRKEDGTAVFTFNIAGATFGPAQNDGIFTGK
jgi:hypothetical protein